MTELVFATNNQHKLDEIRAKAGSHLRILSLKDIGCFDEIPETAPTLEGNALIKARFIHTRYGLNCLADDTGLEIEALQGRPGVYSARYAGPENDSLKNIRKVLHELKGQADRTAQFRTVIALILDEKEYLFEGIVKGEILSELHGSKGFGYDPVFRPEGFDCSFAEMDMDMKNQISHRGIAVGKLLNFLFSKQEKSGF